MVILSYMLIELRIFNKAELSVQKVYFIGRSPPVPQGHVLRDALWVSFIGQLLLSGGHGSRDMLWADLTDRNAMGKWEKRWDYEDPA